MRPPATRAAAEKSNRSVRDRTMDLSCRGGGGEENEKVEVNICIQNVQLSQQLLKRPPGLSAESVRGQTMGLGCTTAASGGTPSGRGQPPDKAGRSWAAWAAPAASR